jgi:hypothetical protein
MKTNANSTPTALEATDKNFERMIHKFFACRAGMRPEDPKDRNPRNFDNGSNFNWRAIFLFVVFTSIVLAFFLFARDGSYGSEDGPAPIPPSERSLPTIVARRWSKVSNGGLQLGGPAFDREGHLLFLETYAGTSNITREKN